jgi:hypothetical protein
MSRELTIVLDYVAGKPERVVVRSVWPNGQVPKHLLGGEPAGVSRCLAHCELAVGVSIPAFQIRTRDAREKAAAHADVT